MADSSDSKPSEHDQESLLVPVRGSGPQGLSVFVAPPGVQRHRVSLRRCNYPVVRRACRNLGWGVAKSKAEETASLVWMDRFGEPDFRRLGGARVNHFPGMREICAKCALSRHLNRMQSAMERDYGFFPPSFVLPADRHRMERFWELVVAARNGKRAGPARLCADPVVPQWLDMSGVCALISKPDTECQGRGIALHGDVRGALRAAGIRVASVKRKRRTSDDASGTESKHTKSSAEDEEEEEEEEEDDSDDSSDGETPIPTRLLVQSYIPRPVLLGGFKFDLRIYCIVTGVFPSLRVFLHRDGLCRLATRRYVEPKGAAMRSKRRHLTNHAVNKGYNLEGDGVVLADAAENAAKPTKDPMGPCSNSTTSTKKLPAVLLARDENCNKWSMRALLAQLRDEGFDSEATWRGIKDLTAKTVISIAALLAHEYSVAAPGGAAAARAAAEAATKSTPATERQGNAWGEQGFSCFEVLGLDVLLVEPKHSGAAPNRIAEPVLLEVNQLPSFGTDTALDEEVKRRVITDALAVASPTEAQLLSFERRARKAAGLPEEPLEEEEEEKVEDDGSSMMERLVGGDGPSDSMQEGRETMEDEDDEEDNSPEREQGADDDDEDENNTEKDDDDEDEDEEDETPTTKSETSGSPKKRVPAKWWRKCSGRLAAELEEEEKTGKETLPPLDSCLTAPALSSHALRILRARRLWEEWCLRAPWASEALRRREVKSADEEGENMALHAVGSGLERVLPPAGVGAHDLRREYEAIMLKAPSYGPRSTAALDRRRIVALRKRRLLEIRASQGFAPRFAGMAMTGGDEDLMRTVMSDKRYLQALRRANVPIDPDDPAVPSHLLKDFKSDPSLLPPRPTSSSSLPTPNPATVQDTSTVSSMDRAAKTAAAAERARQEHLAKEADRDKRRQAAAERRRRRESQLAAAAMEALRDSARRAQLQHPTSPPSHSTALPSSSILGLAAVSAPTSQSQFHQTVPEPKPSPPPQPPRSLFLSRPPLSIVASSVVSRGVTPRRRHPAKAAPAPKRPHQKRPPAIPNNQPSLPSQPTTAALRGTAIPIRPKTISLSRSIDKSHI